MGVPAPDADRLSLTPPPLIPPHKGEGKRATSCTRSRICADASSGMTRSQRQWKRLPPQATRRRRRAGNARCRAGEPLRRSAADDAAVGPFQACRIRCAVRHGGSWLGAHGKEDCEYCCQQRDRNGEGDGQCLVARQHGSAVDYEACETRGPGEDAPIGERREAVPRHIVE